MKCEGVSHFFAPQKNLKVPQTVRLEQRLKMIVGKVKTAIANLALCRSELKVSERRDRQGNLYYQVYDPLTRRFTNFGSEAEIRYWLEQRYSR
jgi:hypothetical protein